MLLAQLVIVSGWIVSNTYIKSHDDIESNYIKSITFDEFKKSFEKNDCERLIYIGRRSCPQCLNFVIELKSFLEANNLYMEYYSTEFDRVSRQDELYSFLEKEDIDSVPMVLIQGEGGETIKRFEGEHILDDMREYFKEFKK